MNWEHVEANWRQLRGRARARWGRLTDDDLDLIAGKRDALVGKLQVRYGTSKEAVETQIEDWSRHIDDDLRAAAERRTPPNGSPRSR
jgi:uncharacterized protein YjbJ (UPF0337 family)